MSFVRSAPTCEACGDQTEDLEEVGGMALCSLCFFIWGEIEACDYGNA